MYDKIMVPVDLAHAEALEKALSTAADLAKHYDAATCYVGITTSEPSAVAHNPKEFAQKFEAFAAEQSKKRGIEIEARAIASPDPARDLDDRLSEAIEEWGADLVIMASHVPNLSNYLFASNAGYLASHTSTSVFVVR